MPTTPRRPFPYYNPFRDYVQGELNRRRLRPSIFGVGNQSGDHFTPAISPFVRFTSTIQDNKFKYKFFSLGFHGVTDRGGGASIFDLTYGSADVIGFAYSTDGSGTNVRSTRNARKAITALQSSATEGLINPALGRHPPPGVLSVSIKHLGLNNYIEMEVVWQCYNNVQLEFLRPHFIAATGAYVVVEIGHQYSDNIAIPTFDFGRSDALAELTNCVVQGRQYINEKFVRNARGNYDIYIGQVVDATIDQHQDGTFEVTTKIASKGEAMFGLDNNRLQGGSNNPDPYIHTIADYFDAAAVVGFARLLSDKISANDPGIVEASTSGHQFQSNFTQARSGQPANESTSAQLLQSGPAGSAAPGTFTTQPGLDPQIGLADTVFVSWNFFMNTVLPDLFAHFTGSNISNEIQMFYTINQSHTTEDDEPWIGNNPNLLSTDVDTMLIITAKAKQQEETGLFANVPTFGDDKSPSGQFRGRLSQGVWLNAEAIRQAFLQHNRWLESMQDLLRKMNNASADYWKLDIRWDEDKNRIIIYDRGPVSDTLAPPTAVYKFNKRAQGDLLGMSFNAAYSKEVMAAIMLSTQTPPEQVSNTGPFTGGLQGPDIHGMVINAPIGSYTYLLNNSISNTLQPQNATVNRDIAEQGKREFISKFQEARTIAAEAAQQQAQAEKDLQTQIKAKFNKALVAFTDLPSIIKEKVRQHGLANASPNNYIAPVPTEIGLSLIFQGIGGISFFDAFQVDKIPVEYEQRGTFLVNSLQQMVSVEGGWRTTIGGVFYFLHHTPVTVPVSVTDQPTNVSQDTLSGDQLPKITGPDAPNQIAVPNAAMTLLQSPQP